MNNLKVIRISKGLSQFELSKLSNIAQSDISGVENNKIYPYPKWRKRISEALQVSEKEIFPDESEV